VDPKTGKKEIVHTYGWYMRRYLADAKEKGATPIVLSQIPRNIWTDAHTVVRASNDYTRQVGSRSSKVRVCPVHRSK